MTPKTARIGSWIVLVILVLMLLLLLLLVLVLAIVFVIAGWSSADVATGQSMSIAGYVAMTLGIVATLALDIAMLLVFLQQLQRSRLGRGSVAGMKNGRTSVRSTCTPIDPTMLPSDKRLQCLP